VVMLLDSGADTEMRDNAGRTALWHATAFGCTAVIDALISRGADVDAADYRLRDTTLPSSLEQTN